MRMSWVLLLLSGCLWPVDVGHNTAALCTMGQDATCNADSSQSSLAGTCVAAGSTVECLCHEGFAVDSAGHCAVAVCTPGVALSCNEVALDGGVAGQCTQSGTARECACSAGFEKSPTTGRCRPAVACGAATCGAPGAPCLRLLFTVDFNPGGKDGNCMPLDRFRWATDEPGKRMFIVGWIFFRDPPGASGISNPALVTALGGTPNSVPMYDDGTHGDHTAGDGIWSLAFDVPPSTATQKLRIGYKYTWGAAGEAWSNTEEWPGDSRFIEVVDDNGDGFVYRRDVFGDEATNKNDLNLNSGSTGSLTWATDLHACGTPESHENAWDNATCACGTVPTPTWLVPITASCSP
jgi:hypothetical protein